jgi:hypothetical protein
MPPDVRLKERNFFAQYEDKTHKLNCSICNIMLADCSKKGEVRGTSYSCPQCLVKPALCV